MHILTKKESGHVHVIGKTTFIVDVRISGSTDVDKTNDIAKRIINRINPDSIITIRKQDNNAWRFKFRSKEDMNNHLNKIII